MSKLKVAIVGWYPILRDEPMSGSKKVCFNLYNELKEESDLELTLFRPLSIKNMVKIAVLKCGNVRESGDCNAIYGWAVFFKLFSSRFDVIHFAGFPGNIVSAFLAKRFLHSKIIYTVNGLIGFERRMGYNHPLLYEKIEKRLMGNADVLVTVSKSLKSMIMRVHGFDPDSIVVVPNGVESNFLNTSKPIISRDEINRNYGLSSDHKIIFTAGGSRPIKDISFALEAFRQLNRENTVLLISGPKGSDHHIVEEHQRINVKYVGYLDNLQIRSLYHASDIYLQTSRYESFGLAPLEAMAARCPVIVTDKVGMSYLIKDGCNGYVVRSGDVKGIIRKISMLLDDRELRKNVGKQAHLTAKKMTWGKVAGTYVELYKELVG